MESDKEILAWLYERLVYVYKENESVDYMRRFKKIIDAMNEDDK